MTDGHFYGTVGEFHKALPHVECCMNAWVLRSRSGHDRDGCLFFLEGIAQHSRPAQHLFESHLMREGIRGHEYALERNQHLFQSHLVDRQVAALGHERRHLRLGQPAFLKRRTAHLRRDDAIAIRVVRLKEPSHLRLPICLLATRARRGSCWLQRAWFGWLDGLYWKVNPIHMLPLPERGIMLLMEAVQAQVNVDDARRWRWRFCRHAHASQHCIRRYRAFGRPVATRVSSASGGVRFGHRFRTCHEFAIWRARSPSRRLHCSPERRRGSQWPAVRAVDLHKGQGGAPGRREFKR